MAYYEAEVWRLERHNNKETASQIRKVGAGPEYEHTHIYSTGGDKKKRVVRRGSKVRKQTEHGNNSSMYGRRWENGRKEKNITTKKKVCQ